MPRIKFDEFDEVDDKGSALSVRSGRFSVYYEKSVTKNLGNYESAKVTVGVTLPLEPNDEELAKVKKTLEIGDKVVTEELEIQLKELE